MKHLILFTVFLGAQAFAEEQKVLEPVLIKNVSQYRNLMPGPGPRKPDVTLIKIEYFRCGGLSQESVSVKAKEVAKEKFEVALYAPNVDCAGLPRRQEATLSVNSLPKGVAIRFLNPVLVDYLPDAH